MNTLLRKIEVRLNYAMYAFQKMNRPHLGDMVTYKGEHCFLNQEVAAPYWDLVTYRNFGQGEGEARRLRGEWPHGDVILLPRVHESEFTLENTLKRKLWAFRSSYKFKMDNWYLIDTWGKMFGSPISSI